jgi:hypothetical protein
MKRVGKLKTRWIFSLDIVGYFFYILFMTSYDSKADTLEHIRSVNQKLIQISTILLNRAVHHDQSKLESPEKELFDEYTPLLKTLTYGSDEYKQSLEKLKPALDHHYFVNRHHPQHTPKGIDGMSLIDVVEMFADWWAATERTNDGDIIKSIDINAERFQMSPQLVAIFKNTVQSLKAHGTPK